MYHGLKRLNGLELKIQIKTDILLVLTWVQTVSCADPGIFVRGGPGQSDKKKSSDNVFLVLILFYRSQMVNFKEIYHFSRFQRGFNIFQGGGGSNFFQGGGGSNCIFPIETHITCDLPGGGGSAVPPPPSGSALVFAKVISR